MNVINIFNEKGNSLKEIMKSVFITFYLNNKIFRGNDNEHGI